MHPLRSLIYFVCLLAAFSSTASAGDSANTNAATGRFPFTQIDTPPKADGLIEFSEYPSSFSGLVDSNTELRALSELAGTIFTASDERNIYLAATIELPSPSYQPVSSSAEDNHRLLVARGDLFVLMLRPDTEAGSAKYSGIYVSVAPNGAIYQSRQEIDWNAMNVVRTPEETLVTAHASRVRDGLWTVELTIPKKAVGVEKEFLFSTGFQVGGRRPSLAPHLVWWDHFDAFSLGEISRFAVTSNFTGEKDQMPAIEIIIDKEGDAEPTELIADLTVQEAVVSVTSEGYKYDQQFGQRLAVQTGRALFEQSSPGRLLSGEPWQEIVALDMPKGEPFLIVQSVQSGADAVFARRAIGIRRAAIEVELRPYPSSGLLEAHIAVSRLLAGSTESARVALCSEGTVLSSTDVPLEGARAVAALDMKTLVPGTYEAKVELRSDQGAVLDTRVIPFQKRATPDWLKQRAGIKALDPTWCPDPWTPVQVEGSLVKVWGREFDFSGSTLLAGITSRGEQLLGSQGAKLVLQAGEKDQSLSFDFGPPEWELQAAGRVVAKRIGRAGAWEVAAHITIEFDGFCAVTLKVCPPAGARLNQLTVAFPLRDMIFFNDGPFMPQTLKVPGGQFRFSNGRTGLGFVVDTFHGALVDSRAPRFVVSGNGDAGMFEMLPVNVPTAADQPVHFTFGLHPSPFRPLWVGWRDLRPVRDPRPPRQANVQFLTHRQWTDGQRPYPSNWELFRFRVALDHAEGFRVYPYSCPSAYSFYRQYPPELGTDLDLSLIESDPIKAREALDAIYQTRRNSDIRMKRDSFMDPDPAYFKWEWQMDPVRFEHSHTGQPTLEYHYLAMDGTWQDFFVHSIAEGFRRTAVDGYYFDLAAPQQRFQNLDPRKNFRFVTLDGTVEGSFPFFATRDFYKRLYFVAAEARGNERPYYFVHGSNSIPGISSFWDVAFSGESLRSINEPFGLTQGLVTGSDDEKPYDARAFRAMFDATASGIPTMFLPQYTYHPHLQTVEMAREILSLASVHNTLVWPYHKPPKPFYDFWGKVEIPFGMKNAEFFPYDNNAIDSGNPAVKVSFWRNVLTGQRLFIAANWSGIPVEPAIFLPDATTIKSGHDPESSQEQILSDGVWRPNIPAHDFRTLILEPSQPPPP